MPFLSFHSALTLEEVGMLHESCPPNGATREGDPARKQALSLPSPRVQIPTRAPDSSQLLRKSKALLSFICNFFFFLRWSTTGWAAGSSLKMYTIFFFFLISQVLGRGEGRWYPHLGRKGWEAHSAKVIYLPVGLAQEPWVPQTDHQ